MSRKMPRQKPHRSTQDYATPRRFLAAVEARFGRITWDLAAHAGNSVCGDRYFGPGSRWSENALDRAWSLLGGGLLWLNPPFENLPTWAAKCADEGERGAQIALLAPAAVSTNWFAEYVDGNALVLPIRPRLTFVGQTAPYPKDLLIAVYGEPPGFECWRWDRPAGHGGRGMSWLPWNRQPAPLPTQIERLRKDLERAEAAVGRAVDRESAAWVALRGAMRDAATAAELRLKARRALEEAEAEEPATADPTRGTP